MCAVDALTTERLPRLVTKPRNDAVGVWVLVGSCGERSGGQETKVTKETKERLQSVILNVVKNLLRADKRQK